MPTQQQTQVPQNNNIIATQIQGKEQHSSQKGTRRQEKEASPAQTLYIFSRDDLERVEQLKRKIVLSPLKFLLTTSAIAFLAKKLNLRKLLANPLKDEADIVKNDKYWRFATYNTIVMGTLGFAAMSFYRSEANKILLYKKYEKHVSKFMKWRTEKQVKQYLKRTAHDD